MCIVFEFQVFHFLGEAQGIRQSVKNKVFLFCQSDLKELALC